MASEQVHACGQPHQAISSEHFLLNLNFEIILPSIACLAVFQYTWQMRSSAAHQCTSVLDLGIYNALKGHVVFSGALPSTKKYLTNSGLNHFTLRCAHQNLGVAMPGSYLKLHPALLSQQRNPRCKPTLGIGTAESLPLHLQPR